jgi:hypothetical protein
MEIRMWGATSSHSRAELYYLLCAPADGIRSRTCCAEDPKRSVRLNRSSGRGAISAAQVSKPLPGHNPNRLPPICLPGISRRDPLPRSISRRDANSARLYRQGRQRRLEDDHR